MRSVLAVVLSILCILGTVAIQGSPEKEAKAPLPEGEIYFSVRIFEGVYQSKDVPGGVESTPFEGAIHSVGADGKNLKKIFALGKKCDFPVFSPDGRWLYFQANTTGSYQIYRCRPDGADVTNISPGDRLGKEWNQAYGAALAADGRKMVYTVHNGASGRVVVADADGSNPRFVAPQLGYIYMACLSPDGDRVVFSGPAAGYRLKLVQLPDGKPIDLTPQHPDSYVPRFTPDGKTIIFFRRDGDVYSVGADGAQMRRLTEGNRYVEFRLSPLDRHGSSDPPDLSPDGKHIAYIAVKKGVPNGCTMDVDGKNQKQITFRKTPCGRVRWSPDGRWLAFVSFEESLPQLFVVAAAGGEPRRLTNLKGAVCYLQWRPMAAK